MASLFYVRVFTGIRPIFTGLMGGKTVLMGATFMLEFEGVNVGLAVFREDFRPYREARRGF